MSGIRSKPALVALSLTLLMLLSPIFTSAAYQAPSQGSSLVNQFAPVLRFNKGENFYPIDSSYAITNGVLKVMEQNGPTLVNANPTSAMLAGYTTNAYFLDNKLGGFSEILTNYQQVRSSLGYTVYAREVQMSGYTVLQYWFFYAYNDAPMNQHEGDWEGITIVLSGSSPMYTAYSQHDAGQRAAWTDVEKVDVTHPVVYVARGSHANYYRPYQGKLGVANDDVGGDGFSIASTDYSIVTLGEPGNHPADQGWLDFGGRWGDWAKISDATLGNAGPFGPAQGDNAVRWAQATQWTFSLPQIDQNQLYLDLVMANLLWIFLGISGVQALWKLIGIARLSRQGGLRLGAVMKSRAAIGVIIGFLGVLVGVGAVFLPYYLVRANIQTSVMTTGGTVDLIKLDGLNGIAVNLLSSNGFQPLGTASIPFGILIAASVVLTILDLIGVKKVKKLGSKYVVSGLLFFVFVAIIYGVMILFLGNLPAFVSQFVGGAQQLPPEVIQLTNQIAASPIQGTTSMSITGVGSVYMEWGIQLGVYVLVVSAIMRLLGGLILRFSPDLPEPGQAVTNSHPFQSVQRFFCGAHLLYRIRTPSSAVN